MDPFPWKTHTPHKLPLKKIAWHSFQNELIRAHLSLSNYRSLSLSAKITQEAIDSLYPIKASSKQFLKSPRLKKFEPIRNYQSAFKNAYRTIHKRPINKNFLCELHAKIKQGELGPSQLGTYRKEPNWIGPEGKGPEQAYYFCPSPHIIEPCMKNLIDYCKKDDKDPLVQIAIVTAQLLIIHPFIDGNGRIARMLIPLLLSKKGLPPVFLSHYFKKHRLKYFQYLYDITSENAWEKWIIFFLKGISSQAKC